MSLAQEYSTDVSTGSIMRKDKTKSVYNAASSDGSLNSVGEKNGGIIRESIRQPERMSSMPKMAAAPTPAAATVASTAPPPYSVVGVTPSAPPYSKRYVISEWRSLTFKLPILGNGRYCH